MAIASLPILMISCGEGSPLSLTVISLCNVILLKEPLGLSRKDAAWLLVFNFKPSVTIRNPIVCLVVQSKCGFQSSIALKKMLVVDRSSKQTAHSDL